MGKSIEIHIAGQVFRNKTSLLAFLKIMLNKYELEETINENDLNFLTALLERHPEYLLKIGSGIDRIVIKKQGKYQTRCFIIVRTDKSTTDFSYAHCVNNDLTNEPKRMFNASCRSAVDPQVKEFKFRNILRKVDGSYYVICQITKNELSLDEAHVDHTPPLTFDNIVNDFIKKRNLNPSKIQYMGFDDNESDKRFEDSSLEITFAEYHREVANLRMINKFDNLKQNKKMN